jgi:16S rRNA C967 or C1407 C5-methylase (RsmB/RsmF family)/NOL1/NOP2/fmu family ribosome biogenesis protein
MILPELFTRQMKKMLDHEFDKFQQSFDNELSTSIRINPAKFKGHTDLIPVKFCDTGYFVPERPVFTLDPFFHSGVYYVQESSSMFLEQVIKQLKLPTGLKALDLCAAPGGKSTHLATLLTGESLLVSNEVIRARGQILSENLKKWGIPNVIVTNNDPRDFQRLPQFFDLLLIDAPCSGEGLFRRDINSTLEWSPENVRMCAQRQRRIIADVWPTLKEGGILIYSTCTYNIAENEENILWLKEFADIEPVTVNISDQWGITITDIEGFPCYRFYPHKSSGEGFFMAVVRKTKGNEPPHHKKIKENTLPASKAEKVTARKLFNDENLEVLRFEDALLAFPSHQLSELFHIRNNLRILHAGVKIGAVKQKDLLPTHELALSTIINRSAIPEIDLNIEEAINYLKRFDISRKTTNPGWNLITYRATPLGLAKNLGSRFNSTFPKEWRIRMSVSEFRDERLRDEMTRFPL